MTYRNPTFHNGFTISAFAHRLPEGCWQGQLLLTKQGYLDQHFSCYEHKETEGEAEQSAIAMGFQIANYCSPGRVK